MVAQYKAPATLVYKQETDMTQLITPRFKRATYLHSSYAGTYPVEAEIKNMSIKTSFEIIFTDPVTNEKTCRWVESDELDFSPPKVKKQGKKIYGNPKITKKAKIKKVIKKKAKKK